LYWIGQIKGVGETKATLVLVALESKWVGQRCRENLCVDGGRKQKTMPYLHWRTKCQ